MKIKLTKDHKYKIGKKEYISVTTFIKEFFEEFKEKEVAKKLSNIPKFKAEKKGMRYWLKRWKYSRDQGTLIHKEIQEYIQKGIIPKEEKALSAVKFFEIPKNKSILSSEVIVYSDKYKLAGTIDVLEEKEEGVYNIIDWKTNEEIRLEGYKGKTGKNICKDIQDSNYWHYALQLNLYKFILEENNIKVELMKLVHLEEGAYSVYIIPDMREIIIKMLEERI
jgi:ATP-dependent exoDNAse (exonuclease V) beta subunit